MNLKIDGTRISFFTEIMTVYNSYLSFVKCVCMKCLKYRMPSMKSCDCVLLFSGKVVITVYSFCASVRSPCCVRMCCRTGIFDLKEWYTCNENINIGVFTISHSPLWPIDTFFRLVWNHEMLFIVKRNWLYVNYNRSQYNPGAQVETCLRQHQHNLAS